MPYKLKNVQRKLYLAAEKEVGLSDIPELEDSLLDQLHLEAERKDLKIVGPTEYIFLSRGDLPSSRLCIIGLPIEAKKGAPEEFFYYDSEPFLCAQMDVKCSLKDLDKRGWRTLYQEVSHDGLYLANQHREIMKKWVGRDSDDNIIELELGVLARKGIS